MDTGSKVSLDRAIETAQRANTLVYSILYADPEAYGHQGYPGGMGGGMGRHGGWGGPGGGMGRGPGGGGYPQQASHPDGKKVLERISRETGGRFFEVSKKQPIDQIYTQIEQELRNQYSLGYTPDKAVAGSGYHKITSDHHQQRPHRADARGILRGAVAAEAKELRTTNAPWRRTHCCIPPS